MILGVYLMVSRLERRLELYCPALQNPHTERQCIIDKGNYCKYTKKEDCPLYRTYLLGYGKRTIN
jgi:hypothetical protein